MTPEAAVGRLAEIIIARPDFTEDDLYDAMAEVGIPDPIADQAYKFAQTAWGRTILDGLGVRFHPDYLCLNAAGDVIESGQIADQPYFTAAVRLVPQYALSPGFQRFVMTSADVVAVNAALDAGSKPEDLVIAPAVFFMEAPTHAGMDKARQLLSSRMQAQQSQ